MLHHHVLWCLEKEPLLARAIYQFIGHQIELELQHKFPKSPLTQIRSDIFSNVSVSVA